MRKLRAELVPAKREPHGPFFKLGEAVVGGKGAPLNELVLVAAETNGSVVLAHADKQVTGRR